MAESTKNAATKTKIKTKTKTKKSTAGRKPAVKKPASDKKAAAVKKPAVKPSALKPSGPKTSAPKVSGRKTSGDDGVALSVTGVGGAVAGEVTLAASVFGLRPNDHLLYEAVKLYRAGGRAGTHKTKNRGSVSGSGKTLPV